MPRDKRTFITVHDGMPDHPKIEPLSDNAFRLLVTLWCWSSRNRTDGEIPEGVWKRRGSLKSRRELMRAGLVEARGEDVDMHDYLEHQRSAAEIDELARKRAEAGSKGGKSAASARATATANLQASDVANEWQDASKIQAESDTDTSSAGFSRGA